MKRKGILLLAALMFLVLLSGCCLKHDMQPATCTEPATCSKCGKTEGEPLGHTEEIDAAVEPTCTEDGLTEGTHCSVCGEVLVPQETVEASGHTWQEATCTDPKTCAVCGETEGEPLGHDWEPATFSEPKTCRICGAAEGEALGSRLFVNALNPEFRAGEATAASEEMPLEPEETPAEAEEVPIDAEEVPAATEETTGEPETVSEEPEAAADAPLRATVRVTGTASGLGEEADEFINGSSLVITIDGEEENRVLVGMEEVIRGSRPVNALIAVDETGVEFTLPGITEEIYRVDLATLQGWMEEYAAMPLPGGSAELASAGFDDDGLREKLVAYEEILFGVADLSNTTETVRDYELAGLGETRHCRVILCCPTAEDWSRMLRSLLTTLQEDDELQELIVAQATGAYTDEMQAYLGSREDFREIMKTTIREGIASALEDVDSLAASLEGTSLEVAYDGGRVYCLKLTTGAGECISYESFGTADTERVDALFLYGEEEPVMLAVNRLTKDAEGTDGQLRIPSIDLELSYAFGKNETEKPFFDLRCTTNEMAASITLEQEEDGAVLTAKYDAPGSAVQIDAVITEEAEDLEMPEGLIVVLETEEDLEAAADKIEEDLYNAELFGHVWQEATCTDPKTCTVCGTTEGEPLGHDWVEQKDGSLACSRCDATEGSGSSVLQNLFSRGDGTVPATEAGQDNFLTGLAGAILAGNGDGAAAEADSIWFRNDSGALLAGVYVSPTDADYWGERLNPAAIGDGEGFSLGADALSQGPGIEYDVGAVDENDMMYEFYGIPLQTGDTMTLLIPEGETSTLTVTDADGNTTTYEGYCFARE